MIEIGRFVRAGKSVYKMFCVIYEYIIQVKPVRKWNQRRVLVAK